MTPASALSEDEIARLRAVHAHRYPQLATVRAPMPDGSTVAIQMMIGLPSGACRMGGSPVSPAWSQFVRSAMTRAGDEPGWREMFVQDVVLHPSPGDLAAILDEWPALATPIAAAALSKIGRDSVTAPTPLDRAPEPIAAALKAHERAVWRWVKPSKRDAFAVAIAPPSSPAWSIFSDQIRAPDANHFDLSRQLCDACVVACSRSDGQPATFGEVASRFPGAVLSVVGSIGMIAGAVAEVELGE